MPNKQEDKSAYTEHPFELVAVTTADAPEGATGNRWCKYIIAQGRNRIVGYSQGTVRTVRRNTRAKVEELNRRRYGAKGPPQKGREQPKKAS